MTPSCIRWPWCGCSDGACAERRPGPVTSFMQRWAGRIVIGTLLLGGVMAAVTIICGCGAGHG